LLFALHITLVALSTLSQRGELYNRKMNHYESHFGKIKLASRWCLNYSS